MTRRYSELTFVSGSLEKHEEYRSLLGISDLRWSNVKIPETQHLDLHVLVGEKIELVRPKLPGEPFFVEHTGLIIDAWNGLPGGLTAVFMDTVGNNGICQMLRGYRPSERTARAKVVIGFYEPERGAQTFDGEVTGTIANRPRGEFGFGWDPIFIPDGEQQTYAEMPLEEKNRTSMRSDAVEGFRRHLARRFIL